MMGPQLISIVTTVYNSERFIEDFYRRSAAAAESTGFDFEMIIVNDGSPDSSRDRAVEIHRQDPRVAVVDLARNFGHHRAMMIGLAHAQGDLVFLQDSDLEEAPEDLGRFLQELEQTGADVIYGVQETRRGAALERIAGDLFYRIVEKVCAVSLPRNIVTSRLMRRYYVDALVSHDEREMVISGLWQLTGFDQRSIKVAKGQQKRPSSYSTLRKLELFIDFALSYSYRIPYILIWAGLLVVMISSLFIAYVVLNWLVAGSVLSGWTSIVASIAFFSGINMSMLGIVGYYAAKTFIETKRRPYSIVRQLYDSRQAVRDGARTRIASSR